MKEIKIDEGKVAIVDDEDFDCLIKYKWRIINGYAVTYIPSPIKQTILMHRIILKPNDDEEVDHINRNRLDNRKENLRIATRSQNLCNRKKINKEISHSKYKGVTINKGNFQARVVVNKKKYFDRCFTDEIAAANAYNYYAVIHQGEFAVINDCPFMEKEEWEKFMIRRSSSFKGVHWHRREGKWRASYKDPVTSKTTVFGFFDSEIVAANMYNHMMKEKLPSEKLNNLTKDELVSIEDCESLRWKRNKSSKYRGVFWDKKSNKWRVAVYHKGKNYYLNGFVCEDDAAEAYNKKAIELNINNLHKKLNIIEGRN